MADGPVFLFYALNGTGGGHITRQTNIAREVRALLRAIDVPHDLVVLTTSDAPQIAHGLLTYKLPSKTSIGPAGVRDYIVRSQTFVMNTVAAMRPSVLVMDTAPEGSFNEIGLLCNLAASCVFVNRHRDEAQQADAAYQRNLSVYASILTPDDATEAERYVFGSEDLRAKNSFVGVIHGYRRERALTRDEARTELDVFPSESLIYISAGAGGDPEAERTLEAILDALGKESNLRFLVGYGPLYKGRIRHRRNVIAFQDVDVSRYFAGVDAAFSAAGYNTYHELLAAHVPTAFFAQVKKMDRQDERVALGVARGWHLALTDIRPETIRRCLANLLSFEGRGALLRSLNQRPVASGATKAAYMVALLGLRAHREYATAVATKLPLAYACRLLWTRVASTYAVTDPEGMRFTETLRVLLLLQANRTPSPEGNLFYAAGALINDPTNQVAVELLREALEFALKLVLDREQSRAEPRVFTDALRLALRDSSDLSSLRTRIADRLAA